MTRAAIGVDIGGTKIAAGLVALDTGRLIESVELPTPRGAGAGAIVSAVEQAAGRMRQAAGDGITPVGLGIGLPELVRLDGMPASQWIADWSGHNLKQELAAFGPVAVDSDVRLAALAELHYGHGRTLPSFVFVSVGTGLSFAYCEDGVIRRGANGFAIHFASSDLTSVDDAGERCMRFNLEAFASGQGMARVHELRTGQRATARDILDGRAGAEGARLLEEAIDTLASYLGQMVNMIDPHGVVIGGGLGTAPAFFERLAAKAPAYIWAEQCRGLPILPSALSATAGMVGAAALHAGPVSAKD